MMNKFTIQSMGIQPRKIEKVSKRPNNEFSKVLNETIDSKVKFSKHALNRLNQRNIQFEPYEINQLKMAMGQARAKGIKETLILMNNKAIVASVQNQTIITVSRKEQLKENVFTNIDGAVIL